MRSIKPANNRLVEGDEARIRQAFMNMKRIADRRRPSVGMRPSDRFVTDMNRLRPLVNKVQEELWTGGL
jgi:2-iminobutanoate/2-iminopropanoate deaminase